MGTGVYFNSNGGVSMSNTVPLGALLATVTLPALFCQHSTINPRDLYLQKLSDDAAPVSAGHHLGVRYSLLLVDQSTKEVRGVDPDSVFHEGDCLAVEFTPNRTGSLYVLNHGSSGDWYLLMPDPEMPDASSTAKAGVTLRVPTDYCFRLDGKPGTETLMLAMTEHKEDAAKMLEWLTPPRSVSHPAAAVGLVSGPGPANVKAIRDEVQTWQRLGSRDLRIQKVGKTESVATPPGSVRVDSERPDSVYTVMANVAPENRLVIEIKFRHE